MSVNDAFVMGAWARDQKTGGKIRMMGDGSATYTKALGLEFDLTARGLGMRCQRFSMLVDDGVVKVLNIEAPGKYEVSGRGDDAEAARLIRRRFPSAASRGCRRAAPGSSSRSRPCRQPWPSARSSPSRRAFRRALPAGARDRGRPRARARVACRRPGCANWWTSRSVSRTDNPCATTRAAAAGLLRRG